MATEPTWAGPTWGPWMGVPKSQQALCAVEGCEHKGVSHQCLYDRRFHHHGCIHYDCGAAEATNHGLAFRPGWGLLCASHYAVLEAAYKRHQGWKANPARQLAEQA